MKIGTQIKIISDSCYHGMIGQIIRRHALVTRWIVLINGDEVAFDEFEMESI